MLSIEFTCHYARLKFPWQKDSSLEWRVRCPHWTSDTFRIVSRKEVEKIEDVCELMTIPFIDLDLDLDLD